ncbi:uncharacterized protein [Triticum aestivum]|uniref:uncharacterized protein n=1 Tax=Triticum aestivum TaxID=4565 RepID=UPI001D027547|nr:uncharacterized protein LOC123143909 [Triticum aestivum]
MGAAGGALSSFVLSHRPLDRRSISSPHLHPVSSPTSATPRRARGAESQKHDADCGGVRRARPVVLSLQGRIRPNLHATSSTPYLLPFRDLLSLLELVEFVLGAPLPGENLLETLSKHLMLAVSSSFGL